ncbi:leucine-rich repeat protein 1-like [Phragmites australis]|uniref:leucine-rich repeat protein 1-like n=1 Tax=Phragmites australis TaxID=29695 RepID=UPI002D7881E8|nr:leucine-rich repeat protein 1-like [Phragmites australis]
MAFTASEILALCSTIILMAVLVASFAPAVANEEGDILTAFRQGLEVPDGALDTWEPNLVNPCTWTRVTCDDDSNRVVRLDLSDLNLSGRLAPELGKLEQLQYMELARNNIQGPIPSEFGDLTNLISLDLYNNNISGPIPKTLGNLKSLKFLRIDHNRLTGPIPRELAGLPDLVDVDLSSNDLCGTIPTSGAFENIPLRSFDNNPRLKGPETQGPGGDDSSC